MQKIFIKTVSAILVISFGFSASLQAAMLPSKDTSLPETHLLPTDIEPEAIEKVANKFSEFGFAEIEIIETISSLQSEEIKSLANNVSLIEYAGEYSSGDTMIATLVVLLFFALMSTS